MRTILFSKDTYRCEIRTSDLICPAFGNNYLDIAFVQESQAIPDNVTIVSNLGGVRITKPLHFSQLADDQLDGVFFNLEWFKYYAPKSGMKAITLIIQGDGKEIGRVSYQLTAGKGEVDIDSKTFNAGSKTYHTSEFYHVGATMRTKHWSNVEILSQIDNTGDFLIVFVGNGHTEKVVKQEGFLNIGNLEGGSNQDIFDMLVIYDDELIFTDKYNIQTACCADFELRITDRHGLRGVMGGVVIADKAEGGDEQKSNTAFTPIAGVFDYKRPSAKIKVDVAFDCNGDNNLLNLLRDACVYGEIEWYCEQSQEWLPCLIEDNSLDTSDPWKEQILTIKLQEL